MACSVRSFSSVHFSMFCVSFSLSCVMKATARWRMEPLFFSQPGTIFASSLMPSLIVSRRRRSTVHLVRTGFRKDQEPTSGKGDSPSLWLSLRILCHSSEPTAGLGLGPELYR